MQIYSSIITVALRGKGTLSAIVSGRDALPRDPRQVRAMVMSSPAPPMVDTLRRVRRRMS